MDQDSRFQYDESIRLHDQGGESWHTPGETLEQDYNEVRNAEVRRRTEDVFGAVARFYYSRNGLLVLGISVLLCLLTATFSPEGLFAWNLVLLAVVWAYFEITSRSRISPEWDEVREEFETI